MRYWPVFWCWQKAVLIIDECVHLLCSPAGVQVMEALVASATLNMRKDAADQLQAAAEALLKALAAGTAGQLMRLEQQPEHMQLKSALTDARRHADAAAAAGAMGARLGNNTLLQIACQPAGRACGQFGSEPRAAVHQVLLEAPIS